MKWVCLSLLVAGVAGCHTGSQSSERVEPTRVTGLERIVVTSDGRGFVTAESRRAFHPWGVNYGNAGRLMEDFWNDDWSRFAGDFRELHALRANVVRVHLQFGRFMDSPTEPNAAALRQLGRLLRLAEENELYLDITGLACYRPADVPRWYDAMEEAERWEAQARFWEAVAAVGAGSRAVFCYDLINEPISPAVKREPGKWASGSLFGEYDFLQYIALDPAGRKREEIAVQWIRRMTAAIRRHDGDALITVGLLPWSPEWKHLSGFLPEAVAPELSFLSPHIYPDSKRPGEAMDSLRHFSAGKPVVIEETFPLRCSPEELERFLRESKGIACGWMGHYDGSTPEELDALEREGKLTLPQAIYRSWLRMFVRLGPEFGR